jgi:hypothetical protein
MIELERKSIMGAQVSDDVRSTASPGTTDKPFRMQVTVTQHFEFDVWGKDKNDAFEKRFHHLARCCDGWTMGIAR